MSTIFHMLMYKIELTNQYTTHKHLKYPEHSLINLFDILLTITQRRLPNFQLAKHLDLHILNFLNKPSTVQVIFNKLKMIGLKAGNKC